MSQIDGGGPAARVPVPAGWVEVEPDAAGTDRGGRTVQVVTPADWDGPGGVRPTLSVTVTAPTSEQVAARVLADAQNTLEDVHVVSIDPWAVPGGTSSGRRLVFAHVDDDTTLTTLVWVTATAVDEVVVTARVDSVELHLHDRALAEAVAGIQLPAGQTASEQPGTAELARRARTVPWAEVAPTHGTHVPMVADPEARILVEASVGGRSLRFDATLARDQATIAATASPRASNHGADGRASAGDGAPSAFRIPVGRLALAVAQWLGLGPAWTARAEPVTVPISLVMNRLVDPSVPAPDGIDAATWQQPWFLWTLRSSATDSGLVMVDAGTSGQCAVMETEDERATRFAPLTSYNVWLTLNWLVSESLVGD